MIAGVQHAPIGVPSTSTGLDQVSRSSSENSITDALASVANSAVRTEQAPHAVPEVSRDTLSAKFSKILRFIRNWGPNHLILQIGPQLHNSTTGIDHKYTPTAVIASDSVEIYPWHLEIGRTVSRQEHLVGGDATRSPAEQIVDDGGSTEVAAHFANGYALGVYQQGLGWERKNRELSYLRQILGRIEVDFPYGNSICQGTIGFEVGITDKTRGFKCSLKHALGDLSQTATLSVALTMADLLKNKDLIGTCAAALIGAFTVPQVLARLIRADADRESTLWLGLSFGYADINATLATSETIPSLNPGSMNLQANAYVRHGEMITYNFRKKVFTLPHALIKLLVAANCGKTPDFVSRILRAKAQVYNLAMANDLPAVAGRSVLDCLDEIALLGVRAINEGQAEHHELQTVATRM